MIFCIHFTSKTNKKTYEILYFLLSSPADKIFGADRPLQFFLRIFEGITTRATFAPSKRDKNYHFNYIN